MNFRKCTSVWIEIFTLFYYLDRNKSNKLREKNVVNFAIDWLINNSLNSYRISEPEPEYVTTYVDADNVTRSCSGVDEDLFMHFLRPVTVGSGDLPWTGLLTGMFIR